MQLAQGETINNEQNPLPTPVRLHPLTCPHPPVPPLQGTVPSELPPPVER